MKVIEKLKEGEPVESRLWDIFSKILQDLRCCYLIVDGFDECLDYDPARRARNAGDKKLFLNKLLQSTRSTTARVLIVSRDEPEIKSSLITTGNSSTAHLVSVYPLTPNDTMHDVQSFTREILDSLGVVDEKAREDAVDKVSAGCEGMFLWVRLWGEQLEEEIGVNTRELHEIVSSMPRGLGHAYQRNLEKLSKMKIETQDRARDILRWMIFAVRPLSVQELFHLLSARGNKFQQNKFPSPIDESCIRLQLIQLCGSLIEVRKPAYPSQIEESTIHFIHFSAKEFLLDAQNQRDHQEQAGFFFPTPGTEHNILTVSCLSSLVFSPDTLHWTQDGSTCYAVDYWTEHFHLSTRSQTPECLNLQRELFKPGPAFDGYIKRSRSLSTEFTPLAVACWYRLLDICKELLMDHHTNPNKQILYWGTALSIAVRGGHKEIIKVLLARKDVDVNCTSNGETPLSLAALQRDRAMLEMLLKREDLCVNRVINGQTLLARAVQTDDNALVGLLLARDGVDANCTNRRGWTPLFQAASDGNKDIFQQLLCSKKVDVNWKSGGQTLLSMAAKEGDGAGIQLLLTRDDVDVNCTNAYGWTPLYQAALDSNKEIVQILLANRKTDPNFACDGHTPLSLAIKEGKDEIVILLFTRDDLDVNCTTVRGRTSLYQAAVDGKGTLVEMLLTRGDLDINWRNKYGETVLHFAARTGRLVLIQQLLAREDLDVNCRASAARTPLHMVASNGDSEAVQQLLVREDLDLNCKDMYQKTPLLRAIENGHEAVVQDLLGRVGVDVNCTDVYGKTPLHRAVERGDKGILKHLLARVDVDVNSKDGRGLTPLYLAAIESNSRALQQVLARRAVDVNVPDKNGLTPLYLAALRGDKAVAQLLLAREDLDVNCTDNLGWTPLHVASKRGYIAIVEHLLERTDLEIDLKTRDGGSTAQSIAVKRGHSAIAKILRWREAHIRRNRLFIPPVVIMAPRND